MNDPRPTPPVFVLVRPQMAENVGMAARAMLNCGMTRMRLVAPREDHTGDPAVAASSGADQLLREAAVFDTLEAALADTTRAYATTARRRELAKEVRVPRAAAAEIAAIPSTMGQTAIVFGPERSGLENAEVALCDTIIEAPLNPGFTSLNLSQAVLLVAWELWQAAAPAAPEQGAPGNDTLAHVPAPREELVNLFAHLEQELDACGFLRVTEKRPRMVQNIRTMLLRGRFSQQEVNTFHGIISELRHGRRDDRPRKIVVKD